MAASSTLPTSPRERGRQVGLQADSLYRKAAERDARDRGKRERVCAECIDDSTDRVLGGIWSELDCMRCHAKPCVGAIVAVDA